LQSIVNKKFKSAMEDFGLNGLAKIVSALSLAEQTTFFEKLGISSHGWLYAYRIPVNDIQIKIIRKKRKTNKVLFKYKSNPGDWCLLNMGSTAKLYSQHRLNYFSKFRNQIKPKVRVTKSIDAPENKDLMYCIPADIAWETPMRTKCFLGGWDIGGNTNKTQAYIKTTKEWKEFLLKTTHSIGPTENNIIPTVAFDRIKKESKNFIYPFTAKFVRRVEKIVSEETLKLLDGQNLCVDELKRDAQITLKICRWLGDDDNLKETRPWDHSQYHFY